MKQSHRFAALLLTLLVCLSLSAQPAYADSSVSGMAYDDLLSLSIEVSKELFRNRISLNEVRVPSGRYTVGVDIPAGSYRCECKGAYSSVVLNLYDSEEAAYPSKMIILAELYESSMIGKLVLKDGKHHRLHRRRFVFFNLYGNYELKSF